MEPTSQSTVIPPAVLASPALRDEVLGNMYILSDIMVNVDSPTTVVRAAAVSKFWRQVASDPDFLRRFGDLHQPLLLGFYITTCEHPSTSFVKMPDLPEELATDVRRGSFNFGPLGRDVLMIFDCRNGYVAAVAPLVPDADGFAIHRVLHPNGGPPVPFSKPTMPPQDIFEDEDPYSIVELDRVVLLPEDGGDGQSCTAFTLVCSGVRTAWVHVREFHAPTWGEGRNSNRIDLPGEVVGFSKKFCILSNGKAYMTGIRRYILALDVASMNLFHIQLPEGVEFDSRVMNNLMLSRAEGSGFNLVHVSGFQLRVWLYSTGADGVDVWTVIDTVDLRQAFGHLANSAWLLGDAICNVVALGDEASFVIFQVLHELFYLHVPSRQVKKVFEVPPRIRDLYVTYGFVVEVDPVMMVWPPTFQLRTDGDGEAQ